VTIVIPEGEPTGADVAKLVGALLRCVLPIAPRLRLEIVADGRGTWLSVTYPAADCGSAPGSWPPAGELAVIDSIAQRWGHCGDTRWKSFWALCFPPDAGAAAAPGAAGSSVDDCSAAQPWTGCQGPWPECFRSPDDY